MWNCSINGPRFHNLLMMIVVVSSIVNVEKWNLSITSYFLFPQIPKKFRIGRLLNCEMANVHTMYYIPTSTNHNRLKIDK